MKRELPELSRASVSVVVGTLLLVGVAGWWTWRSMGEADRAERRLRARQTEWRALQTASPAPTAAVAEAFTRRVAASEDLVKSLRRRLGESGAEEVSASAAPTQRADAFFLIAQFVQAQHEHAKRAAVIVPEHGAFGFSAYTNSGPAMAELAVVHRQQIVVQRLLAALWSAQPRELTRLQREDAARKISGTDPAQSPPPRGGRGDDYFELPAARSAHRHGIVDTLAFRLGFVGKTETLRRFVRAIAAIELPLLVRGIEVEPLGADGRARGGARSLADLFRDETVEGVHAAADADAAIPIIAANDAEFIVTIEYLDFEGPRRAAIAKTEARP